MANRWQWNVVTVDEFGGLCLGKPRSTRNEFRFAPTSEILENISLWTGLFPKQRACSQPTKKSNMVDQAWWKLIAKGAVLSPDKRDLRYCWRSLRLLWVLQSSWSCIVSNPFINVLAICFVPLASITERNSTVQRDILNFSNICWQVHHLLYLAFIVKLCCGTGFRQVSTSLG